MQKFDIAIAPIPHCHLEIERHISYLGWLGSNDWVPSLMLRWRQCGNDERALTRFVERLDRLVYGLRVLGIGADKRAIRFQNLLQAIRSETGFDAPGGPLDLTRDEQRLVLYNLRNIHARSQLTCKLILLRLNDVLAGSPQQLDREPITVEHVLPLRPARNSEWRIWFPTPEARESCTQSLGNLVLITRDRNDRAKNLELRQKLDVYFGDGVVQVPHITRELDGISEWRPAQVLAREERLITAICDMWQLSGRKAGVAIDATMAEANEKVPNRVVARR